MLHQGCMAQTRTRIGSPVCFVWHSVLLFWGWWFRHLDNSNFCFRRVGGLVRNDWVRDFRAKHLFLNNYVRLHRFSFTYSFMPKSCRCFSNRFLAQFSAYFCWHDKRCCGARAEEPKLNCLHEPKPLSKLQIAAPAPSPAPFYFPQTWRNFILKIMVAEEVCVNCYNFNPIN